MGYDFFLSVKLPICEPTWLTTRSNPGKPDSKWVVFVLFIIDLSLFLPTQPNSYPHDDIVGSWFLCPFGNSILF